MSFQTFRREHIVAVLAAAIRAVDPRAAVRSHVMRSDDALRIGDRSYRLSELDRIIVVGGGKAGAPMAAAIHELLGARITAGMVNVKYGHHAGAGGWEVRFEHRPLIGSKARPDAASQSAQVDTGPIAIIEAGHPVPDAAGLAGAERIAALLQGLTERDLVIVLISGGGSALLPSPADAITLADYQALTGLLLRCGADITEINTVRKHCSRLQGGQLARAGRARAGGGPHPLRCRRDAPGCHRLRPDRARPQQLRRHVGVYWNATASPGRRRPPCAHISAVASQVRSPTRLSRVTRCSNV